MGGKQCFSLFGKRRKILRMEKSGENFISRSHKSHPPKSGGKLWGEKWTYGIFTQMPSGIKLKKIKIK